MTPSLALAWRVAAGSGLRSTSISYPLQTSEFKIRGPSALQSASTTFKTLKKTISRLRQPKPRRQQPKLEAQADHSYALKECNRFLTAPTGSIESDGMNVRERKKGVLSLLCNTDTVLKECNRLYCTSDSQSSKRTHEHFSPLSRNATDSSQPSLVVSTSQLLFN